jgi:hypothetical protein
VPLCATLRTGFAAHFFDRKEWIENRLEELADCFAVAVAGFSVRIEKLRKDPLLGRFFAVSQAKLRETATIDRRYSR